MHPLQRLFRVFPTRNLHIPAGGEPKAKAAVPENQIFAYPPRSGPRLSGDMVSGGGSGGDTGKTPEIAELEDITLGSPSGVVSAYDEFFCATQRQSVKAPRGTPPRAAAVAGAQERGGGGGGTVKRVDSDTFPSPVRGDWRNTIGMEVSGSSRSGGTGGHGGGGGSGGSGGSGGGVDSSGGGNSASTAGSAVSMETKHDVGPGSRATYALSPAGVAEMSEAGSRVGGPAVTPEDWQEKDEVNEEREASIVGPENVPAAVETGTGAGAGAGVRTRARVTSTGPSTKATSSGPSAAAVATATAALAAAMTWDSKPKKEEAVIVKDVKDEEGEPGGVVPGVAVGSAAATAATGEVRNVFNESLCFCFLISVISGFVSFMSRLWLGRACGTLNCD